MRIVRIGRCPPIAHRAVLDEPPKPSLPLGQHSLPLRLKVRPVPRPRFLAVLAVLPRQLLRLSVDPIYLGGWAMEPGSNLYISLADYLAPGSDELTPLILITRYDEDGYGVIDNIMQDTVATGSTEESTLSVTPIDIELKPGGKLWPVYYMDQFK